MPPYFAYGEVVVTPGVADACSEGEVSAILGRHRRGDWGDVAPEDAEANTRDVAEGRQLLSAYQLASDLRVWVVTSSDRRTTTVLLPSEYSTPSDRRSAG